MYDAYVKKLKESFFNDLNVTLQSGDIFIGTISFTQSEKLTGSDVKARKVSSWGIVPTRITLRGVGDFKGTYTLKEVRNTLDRSGGFKGVLGLITTDEFIQKGSRMTSAITAILGPNFLHNYISSFIFEKPIKVSNIEINSNMGSKSRKVYSASTERIAAAEEVLSEDAKSTKDPSLLNYQIRQALRLKTEFGAELYQRGGGDMAIVHTAMNENMRIINNNNALDWQREYLSESKQKELTQSQGGIQQHSKKPDDKGYFSGINR
jgi:hypothetical protein